MPHKWNSKIIDTSGDNILNILVIIPVQNEAATISGVIRDLQRYGLERIRVVDNGSTDRSAVEAKDAGAEVVFEPVAGYGCACWRGLEDLPPDIEWILFCDGDGSDDFSCLPNFFALRHRYDFILGNRRPPMGNSSALTPVQKFGNALACSLISLGWGYQYRDLGPLRLIRSSDLTKISMQDRGFGWTVEMQVRAIEENLRICELPVDYYPRQGGKSKISGTISGSIKAGTIILTTLGRLYFTQGNRQQATDEKAEFSSGKTGRNQILLWLSAILLLLGAVAIAPYGDFNQVTAVPRFWWGIAVMCLGFVCSWGLNFVSGWWFWLVAIFTRLILIPMYPGDDVWRYVWEGYIQTQGFSPYDFAPNAAELIPYRTEWWSLINHQGVSAIYPPITQLGFRGLAAIAPSFLLFKMAFAIADLLICWLLTRKYSYLQTTFYAWNPLVIYSFTGGAHYDSWFILPLVAAWLWWERQDWRQNYRRPNYAQNVPVLSWLGSSCLIGISIAVKWISLPILSFIAWQAWRKINFKTAIISLIIGILPLCLASLAFCLPDHCSLIPTNSTFVSYGRSAELIPYLLGQVWQTSRDNNSIFAIPLGLAVIVLLLQAPSFQQFSLGYFFSLLTISPIIHGWYFTWIIPFAVGTQNWGVRLVSLSAFVYFVLPYRQALGHSHWRLSGSETWLLWLPFVAGYFWSIWRSRQINEPKSMNQNQ